MIVPLTPVNSSMLAAYGYDSAQRILAVRFNGSKHVRLFQNVDPEIAEKLAGAESIGKAFNEHVRAKFEHTTVSTDEATHETDAPV